MNLTHDTSFSKRKKKQPAIFVIVSCCSLNVFVNDIQKNRVIKKTQSIFDFRNETYLPDDSIELYNKLWKGVCCSIIRTEGLLTFWDLQN